MHLILKMLAPLAAPSGKCSAPLHRATTHCDSFRNIVTEREISDEASDRDWISYRIHVSQFRSAFVRCAENRLITEIVCLDNFIKRFRLNSYPDLLAFNVPASILTLSTCDNLKLREVSLSILANLTSLVPGFLSRFSAEDLCQSIAVNVLDPLFDGKAEVFRWLSSIISVSSDFLPFLFEGLSLDDLCDSAMELTFLHPHKSVMLFVFQLSRFDPMCPEIMQKCIDFFYYFLRSRSVRVSRIVLQGVHALLSNSQIPSENRIEVVETLKLVEFTSSYFEASRQSDKVNRKLILGFALLGDIFKLIPARLECLIPDLLDFLHFIAGTFDCDGRELLFEALLKIITNAAPEILSAIWNANDYLILGDIVQAISDLSWVGRRLATECLFSFLSGLPLPELGPMLREDVIELLLDLADDSQFTEAVLNSFGRLIEFAIELNHISAFCEMFSELDGFEVLHGAADGAYEPLLEQICNIHE
jgi:hypothetical protein